MKYSCILISCLIISISLNPLKDLKEVYCINGTPLEDCPENIECVCAKDECENIFCTQELREPEYLECVNGLPVDKTFRRNCCTDYICIEGGKETDLVFK